MYKKKFYREKERVAHILDSNYADFPYVFGDQFGADGPRKLESHGNSRSGDWVTAHASVDRSSASARVNASRVSAYQAEMHDYPEEVAGWISAYNDIEFTQDDEEAYEEQLEEAQELEKQIDAYLASK